MKLTDEQTAELYRDLTVRRERGPDCLDDDLLVRAGANKLRAGEREALAVHIANCSDCAREYQIARSMRPFGAAARAELGSRFPTWQALAAAAIAACAVLTFAWRNETGDLRRELARQRQELASTRSMLAAVRLRPVPTVVHDVAFPTPRLGGPIVDIDPAGTRGTAQAATLIAAPKGTDEIILILHLPEEIRAPAQIEMTGANGGIWRHTIGGGIESGTVTLSLPRAFAPPGAYTVRIRSPKGEATFSFRVTDR